MLDDTNKKMVYILDDNTEFRESTIWLLNAMDYDVLGFEDPMAAIEQVKAADGKSEAVLMLDIRMPEMSGLDVHDVLIETGIAMPVIYMTARSDVSIAVSAMSKGALTFLEKPLDENLLSKALEVAFSESVQIRRRVKANRCEYERTRDRLTKLTPRESQIVQGMLGDLSNTQIADEFSISVKTVELYRSKVMHKFGAKSAAHLVRMVMACAPA